MSQQPWYDGVDLNFVVGIEEEILEADSIKLLDREHVQTDASDSNSIMYDFPFSTDMLLETVPCNEEQALIFSQASEEIIREFCPTAHSQSSQCECDCDDFVGNNSTFQQEISLDRTPTSLPQDSLSFLYPESTEQFYNHFDKERNNLSSNEKTFNETIVLNPITPSNGIENDDDMSEISCNFGILSQGDHSVTSLGSIGHICCNNDFAQEPFPQEVDNLICNKCNMKDDEKECEKQAFCASTAVEDGKPYTYRHNPTITVGTKSEIEVRPIPSSRTNALGLKFILQKQETTFNAKAKIISNYSSINEKVNSGATLSSDIVARKRTHDAAFPTLSNKYTSLTLMKPCVNQFTTSKSGSVCSVGGSSCSISSSSCSVHRDCKRVRTSVESLSQIGTCTRAVKESNTVQQAPKTPKSRKIKASTKAKCKIVNDEDNDVDVAIAEKQAKQLTKRATRDQVSEDRLLLDLIMTREKPGTSNKVPASVLSKYQEAVFATAAKPYYMPAGFQWCEYPPLEKLLKNNRLEYFEMSMNPSMRLAITKFNNDLVKIIRQGALQYHWVFYAIDDTSAVRTKDVYNWTDKALRDRIRFYYKTIKQNAKGRLRTMLKNPAKRSNARNLNEFFNVAKKGKK